MFSPMTFWLLAMPWLGTGQNPPAPPEPPANTIRVSVVIILAHGRDAKVDASLTALAQEVQQNIDPKLTSFRVAQWNCENLTLGVRRSLPLVENQVLMLTVNQAADKDGFVGIKVKPPLVTEEVNLCAQCGRFLPIVTRYRTKDGDQLLVALRIHACTAPK